MRDDTKNAWEAGRFAQEATFYQISVFKDDPMGHDLIQKYGDGLFMDSYGLLIGSWLTGMARSRDLGTPLNPLQNVFRGSLTPQDRECDPLKRLQKKLDSSRES